MPRWIGSIISAVIVASAAYFLLGDVHEPPPPPENKRPVSVKVSRVVKKTLNAELPVTMTVRSPQGVMIKAEAEGRITRIFVESSQKVAKNQPLLRIDPYPLQAQLAIHESRLTLYRKNLLRAKELVEQDTISKEAYDQANEAFHEGSAQVARTKALLDLTLVKAPFEGRLGLRRVEEGDYVLKGQDLITFLNPDVFRVDFAVPQNFLKKISIGQKVRFESDALPDVALSARVYAIDAFVGAGNRALQMRAHVENPPEELLPGIFCRGFLLLEDRRHVLVLPQTAVSYSVAGSFVYRVIEGKAVKTPVQIGRRSGDHVVIVSGLNPGELIISEGRIKVGNGSLVKISER